MSFTRERWRQNWLKSIHELTDFVLQQKWLITENSNPHWSFVEFMSCYFDDILIYDYQYYINEGWVTEAEYEVIKDWHMEIEAYEPPNGDVYDHASILQDKKWLNILEKGLLAKQQLSEILSSNEKAIL